MKQTKKQSSTDTTPAAVAPVAQPVAPAVQEAGSAKPAAKTTKNAKNTKVEATPVAQQVAQPVVATPAVQEAGSAKPAKAPKAKQAKQATAEPAVVAQPVAQQEGGAAKPAKATKAKAAKPANAKTAKATKEAKATKATKEAKAPKAKATKPAKAPKAAKGKSAKASAETADEHSEELEGGKRSFKAMLPGSDKFEGRYTGLTPYQAANKALSKYYREAEGAAKTGGEITFSIRESTRGSKRSVYTYNGRREKLEKPVEYTIKGKDGDRTVVKEYKNRLIKVKKAEAEPQTADA